MKKNLRGLIRSDTQRKRSQEEEEESSAAPDVNSHPPGQVFTVVDDLLGCYGVGSHARAQPPEAR